MNFLYILVNIIVPIFIQIVLGYALHKKFNLNVNTLSKIQFYAFIPAFLFVKIYKTELSKELFLMIVLYSLILFFLLYFITWLIAKIRKYPTSVATSFINSVCFYNSGNYCLPLVQLLYNNSFSMSVQVINMMTQNILTNTVGIFNSNRSSKSIKHALVDTLKVPMVYGLILAILLKALNIKVYTPILSAMDIMGQGLVPMALVTLGAQLANTKITFKIPRVYFSNILRLIISPIAAVIIVWILGIQGVAAEVLIISSAAPTAVNSVLLAIEYNNEPDFASQAVLLSTIFSSFTVSMVIYLVTTYF